MKIGISAGVATAVVATVFHFLGPVFAGDTIVLALFRLLIPLVCGVLIYLGLAFSLGCGEIRELFSSLCRREGDEEDETAG